jgi:hypothetical protein
MGEGCQELRVVYGEFLAAGAGDVGTSESCTRAVSPLASGMPALPAVDTDCAAGTGDVGTPS